MTMPFKQMAQIVAYGIGVGSIAAVVYLAGPFVAFGDVRPLENPIVREIIILLIVTVAASLGGMTVWKRQRSTATIVEGMSDDDTEDGDAPVLKDRMKDALATLKGAAKGRATYLYDLPWYILIGPPGSGKTTALVNSGLKFPLQAGGHPAAIAGVGGTRYCDWWFTDEAVLIDTAGRYTTQDSDAKSDRKSWFAFLETLKKGRPRQPINGVLLAISVGDILTLGSAGITAHASAIRARLLELHTQLKVDFPVYALFTKADLILGFNEFFQNLGAQGRAQVLGATFQTRDKTSNLVTEVAAEFDTLVEALNDTVPDRLQDEPAPVARVQLYGFPTQLAALKRPLFAFLNQIFEPTRYHANATLRGFYFTSGTQQGTPIDQLIGALEQSFGTAEAAPMSLSGEGKSYFLTDLIKTVIIGEAAWVSTDQNAVRRAAILRASAYAALILFSVCMAGIWWVGYSRNDALIRGMQASVVAYSMADHGISTQTSIADHDFARILPLLTRLRHLPAGYGSRDDPTPLIQTFGLDQRDRVRSSAIESYHNALERMFRPRLVYRLEEVLDAKRDDPSFLYSALKVYMMLGHQAPVVDDALIVNWMRADWAETLYPGPSSEIGRQQLEDHLTAMLALDDGTPLVTLSQPVLDSAQATLDHLTVTQRAYELLKSRASSSAARPDWFLTKQSGLEIASVFAPAGSDSLSSIHVPFFYTYAGFNQAFLPELKWAAEQVEKERWVLGASGAQFGMADQYKTLRRDLIDLYSHDFIATWQDMLAKIKLKRLTGNKTYVTLTALASPTSPLRQLIKSIGDETNLDREKPTEDAKPGNALDVGPPAIVADDAVLLQDGPPGAAVDDAFRPFQDIQAGDPGMRPIDLLLKDLGAITVDLKRAASNPSDAAQSNADLQAQVGVLRTYAASLPAPLSNMMQKAAADFDNEGVSTTIALLQDSLGSVSETCRTIVAKSYPFVRGASHDVGLVDFGRVFGPSGTLDQYFNTNLAKYADMSGQDWIWKTSDPVGRSLSANALRSFQHASQIRDAFFSAGSAQPFFMVTVTPPMLTDPSATARLDFYGTSLTTQAGTSIPSALPWPGSGSYQMKITVNATNPAVPQDPSTLQSPNSPSANTADATTLVDKSGVWALFRLLDEAGRDGNRVVFYSGGQTYSYSFTTTSAANPLNLSALRQFRCPADL